MTVRAESVEEPQAPIVTTEASQGVSKRQRRSVTAVLVVTAMKGATASELNEGRLRPGWPGAHD
jgi:hypothetical protein